MSKSLIIVESPSKCQKVEKAAGPQYKCLSSKGHIYQLIKGLQAIDFDNNFEPKYQLIPDKKSVVALLKKNLGRYKDIYLASDPDREGEAIAVHLAQELGVIKTAKRITFNEITKPAIQRALENPRQIDFNLYDAQKARRVLDRLMGFEISPLLWTYLPENGNLSAGRCQSPALALIYSREKEIENFIPKSFYDISGNLIHNKSNVNLKIKYIDKPDEEDEVIQILEDCLDSKFVIESLDSRLSESKPPPPFTTSTLQQEASQRLSFNPKRTMQVAQKLYEGAYITYMRTDSTTMSEDAKKDLGKFILDKYGKKYHQARNYTTQSKNAQEAHECVRVTDPQADIEELNGDQKRLYQLILNRSLASQMANKKTKIQDIDIKAISDDIEHTFLSREEEVVFEGYTILYPSKESNIHRFEKGDNLTMKEIIASPEQEKPKPRYTEASLVKALEKSGIGRPSTFSNIISTLLERDYVSLGSSQTETTEKTVLLIQEGVDSVLEKKVEQKRDSLKGKLLITNLGKKVLGFLGENFHSILDDKYTSVIENDLDKVSNGEKLWYEVVKKFYNSFHPDVIRLSKKGGTSVSSQNMRKLYVKKYGVLDGYEYGIRKTKYGNAFVKVSGDDITFLPIVKSLFNKGMNVDIEQVEFLFQLPIDIGDNVSLYYGRNGFYAKHNERSVNLDGTFDHDRLPNSEVVLDKMDKKSSNTEIKSFTDYKIMEGKYGPYIIYKSKFYKIPRTQDPKKMTLNDCKNIVKKSK